MEIVKLREESTSCVVCEGCKGPLNWSGARHNPHLHHNHETGEVYGYAHGRCNQVEEFISPLVARVKELEEDFSPILEIRAFYKAYQASLVATKPRRSRKARVA